MPFAKINGFVKKLCMLALSGIFVILALFLMEYSNLSINDFLKEVLIHFEHL